MEGIQLESHCGGKLFNKKLQMLPMMRHFVLLLKNVEVLHL